MDKNIGRAVVFFDGVCNLCNASVQFVIKRDQKDKFRFAALQSETAVALLSAGDFNSTAINTIILLEEGKVYRRSTAALHIAKHLSGPWPMLYVFIIVPPFIRDFFYSLIAKNRYRIWGKSDSCMVPSAGMKQKFLGNPGQ